MNALIFSIVFFASFNFVISDDQNKTNKDIRLRYGFGERIKLEEIPYFGFFSIFNSTSEKPPVCSGSIIHPRWILTSARCIRNITKFKNNIIFTTAKVNSNFSNHKDYWEHYYPTDLFAHENFKVLPGKGEHSVHDIGIARLMDRLRYSPRVQPIELAQDNTEQYAYQFATFVEWGSYPDEEVLVPMEIASARLCILGRHECIVKTLNTNIDENLHVCGFDNDEHIRACRSDDGSPFVLGKRQIGVATVTTPGCAKEWRPTIFTRVSTYLPWIRKKLVYYHEYI